MKGTIQNFSQMFSQFLFFRGFVFVDFFVLYILKIMPRVTKEVFALRIDWCTRRILHFMYHLAMYGYVRND